MCNIAFERSQFGIFGTNVEVLGSAKCVKLEIVPKAITF